MNAYITSALAILMLVVMAHDAPAVDPPSAPARTARRATEPPKLIMDRLLDRLRGRTAAKAEPTAGDGSSTNVSSSEATSDGDAPSDAATTVESDRSSTFARQVPASATPAIDVDAPRMRLIERPESAAGPSLGELPASRQPPTQPLIELDDTVTAAPAVDGSTPAGASPEHAPPGDPPQISAPPVRISIKSAPLPATIPITSRPAPQPAEPVITARQAPPPVETRAPVEAAAPVQPAAAIVATPRRPLTGVFLADDVRFGPVVRQGSPPPATTIEEEAVEPAVSAPSPAPSSLGTRLHLVPPPLAPPGIGAEDLACRELLRPVSSVLAAPAQPEFVAASAVAPSASPGALLQAIHTYGEPLVKETLAPVALSPSSLPRAAPVPMPSVAPPPSNRAGVGQPTLAPQPTLAEPPAAPLAANQQARPAPAMPARPSTRRAVRAKVVHGQIARVHAAGGYATADFSADVPATGSRASVYRRQLFQRKHLGDVEIFVNSAGQVCVRPQGRLKINELASEDELIVLPQIADGDHDLEATEPAPQL